VNAIVNLARRVRPARHAEAGTVMPANAAAAPRVAATGPMPAPVAAPSFTPAPDPRLARATGPMPAPPAGPPAFVAAHGSHARSGRPGSAASAETLGRALEALRRPSRGTALLRDRRDLPLMRAVAREAGWRALVPNPRVDSLKAAPAQYAGYSLERWQSQALAIADFAARQAIAELRRRGADYDHRETVIRLRRQVAAEAAGALGYPGGDL
jgi:hypothetical protein